MSEGKRVFSEKQAAEVLRRASRLQDGDGSYAPGLTHEEILSIATEAGIDPKNVEAAIRGLETTRRTSRFFNLVEEEERIVDAELDPTEFDVILDVAKPAMTRRHPARQVGRTLDLRTRYKGGMYNVQVSSKAGRTRVEVASMPSMAYLMSLHPALLIAFVGSANLSARHMNLGATVFALVAMMIGLAAFVGLVHRGKEHTPALADLIESKVRETTADVRENLRDATTIEDESPSARTRSV